jgi:hypothetical protein
MREQSIAASIRRVIRNACEEAACNAEDTDKLERRSVALYRRRGGVVHGSASVTPAELNELRQIVRLALTGSQQPGVFTGILSLEVLERRFADLESLVTGSADRVVR